MTAPREQDGVGQTTVWKRGGALLAAPLLSAAAWIAAVACGGTNGQEGLPQPPPAGDASGDSTVESGPDAPASDTSSDAGLDATVSMVDGTDNFDVVIQYADRVLPDVQPPPPPPEGGTTGGFPLCPPDLPAVYGDDGGIVPVYDPVLPGSFEIAAAFLDDGGIGPAPAGSTCATQVYLGAACDACIRSWGGAQPVWFGANGTSGILPPCSDQWDAGVATAGPGQGQSLYTLCMNLLSCYVNSGCAAKSVATGNETVLYCDCNEDLATCNKQGGDGPCFMQEMALFQQAGPYDGPQYSMFSQSKLEVMNKIDHPGGALNWVFSIAALDCSSVCPLDAGFPVK